MIEKVMVMKERTMETVLHVTSSPMLSMSEKISGRLKLIWSQNWKSNSSEASISLYFLNSFSKKNFTPDNMTPHVEMELVDVGQGGNENSKQRR